jgi:hypothetical protein
VTATGDLYPMFNLRWNEGVNNFMTYVTHGHNAWLTLSISPAAPTPPPSARPRTTMYTK